MYGSVPNSAARHDGCSASQPLEICLYYFHLYKHFMVLCLNKTIQVYVNFKHSLLGSCLVHVTGINHHHASRHHLIIEYMPFQPEAQRHRSKPPPNLSRGSRVQSFTPVDLQSGSRSSAEFGRASVALMWVPTNSCEPPGVSKASEADPLGMLCSGEGTT